MNTRIKIERAWLQRLIEIVDDINQPRGTLDAPSRYSLPYLYGYIDSARSLLNAPPEA